jgi:hypothetical protein
MDSGLKDSILSTLEAAQTWNQTFSIPDGSNHIDLSCAVGQDPSTPDLASDQPPRFWAPHCYYKFDSIFKTKESWPKLEAFVKKHLPGSSFAIARGSHATKSKYIKFKLHCTHYRTVNDFQRCAQQFKEGHLTQDNVIEKTIKRQKTAKSFDRMASKSEKKAIQCTQSSKTGYSKNQPVKRRTLTSRAKDTENRCNCVISIILWTDDHYYLDAKNTCLQHTGHCYIVPTAQTVRSSKINDECSTLIHKMSAVGIKPRQITKLLDELEEHDRQHDPDVIKNIISKQKVITDKNMGITHHMPSAEKAIKYLQE